MKIINLRRIFCHLVNDANFLSKTLEMGCNVKKDKKPKKSACNLMANMVSEYITLAPYEKQKYELLPIRVKSFLPANYVRFGIQNVMEKKMTPVNVSFLNSINMLLRPEIYNNSMEDHIKNLNLLEDFVATSIRRNLQVDKIKNTVKVKESNNLLIGDLIKGKISAPVIQRVINIFEINLLIFDLSKMEIYFYWAHGYKYPHINPFNDIYCMAYIQGNYEPIMPVDSRINEDQRRNLYKTIFDNLDEIKCNIPPTITTHGLIYLDTWDIIKPPTFVKIAKICRIHKPQLSPKAKPTKINNI